MKKKHIFIAYTNTGFGHKIPAEALTEAIEKLYPDTYTVTCSNFFHDTGYVKFNKFIENAWNVMLRYSIITRLIVLIGHFFYFWAHTYLNTFHRKVLNGSIDYLKNLNPDIVFVTHWFPQTVALEAKKRFPELKFPVIALNPDTFETFPFWDRRGDLFLVCSEEAKAKALRWKHKENTIQVVSPALRKEFDTQPASPEAIIALKKEYRLAPESFTILMSDGGQGLGKMYLSVCEIIKIDRAINIICICAKNEKLYQQLSALKKDLEKNNSPINLMLFQFVSELRPLISISDLFIGKSGPATVLECLTLRLPVLINFSASSAEKTVVNVFKRQGVLWTSSIGKMAKKVTQFMDNPTLLKEAREKIEFVPQLKNGTNDIVKIIIDTLNNETKVK